MKSVGSRITLALAATMLLASAASSARAALLISTADLDPTGAIAGASYTDFGSGAASSQDHSQPQTPLVPHRHSLPAWEVEERSCRRPYRDRMPNRPALAVIILPPVSLARLAQSRKKSG